MRLTLSKALLFSLLASLHFSAEAHKRWILPSQFTLSETQWVSFDATVSNNIFYADRAWPLDHIHAYNPEAQSISIDNKLEGHRRSVFDVNLEQKGTYKVNHHSLGYMATYQIEVDGELQRKRERGSSLEQVKKLIPENAMNIAYSSNNSRLETYLTVGAPTDKIFTIEGNGIEFKPFTHPNDLYVGEQAKFQFFLDGKPAQNIELSVVRAGTRYRNQEQALSLETDEQGIIEFELTHTGPFLIEIEHRVELDDDSAGLNTTYSSYFGTFEVLPQ